MIELTTGEVITSGKGTFSIYAFYKKDLAYRELPMHEAEKDSKSGIPKTNSLIEMVASGAAVTKKNWATRRHVYPNGSYIKLLMKRTAPRTTAFKAARMSALYLAVRDNAPLQLIEIDLPQDQNSSKSRLYINGRFDILTAEQVEERGLHENAQGSDEYYLFESGEEEIGETIFVTVQEKALAPKASAKVKKLASGKTMVKLRRARKVGLVD